MIEVRTHGTVREICMRRPPVNALNSDLLSSISEALKELEDSDCTGVVLSGSPGVFTGGLDLPFLMTLETEALREALEIFLDSILVITACPIPTAAAITGHSPAGGTVLALCCDRRFMAEGDFWFGLNEVQVGIPMPETVAALARWALGERTAARMCSEGLLISPEQALAVGYVDELHALDRVVQSAIEWVQGLSALPPCAFAKSRNRMRASLVRSVAAARDRDVEELLDVWFDPTIRPALEEAVARIKKKTGSSRRTS
jgi:enoyl-CoA hydratase/carnithine racemase